MTSTPTTHETHTDVSALPPLDLSATLGGKRLLVTGGTGFVGKVWVSMLLHRFPEIGHIYLMVRSKKNITSEQRFWNEIVPSPVFDPIREQYPAENDFRQFIEDHVTAVDGDVVKPMFGLGPDLVEQLRGKLDAIVNIAGVVDFNPPIDYALKTNCFGVQHMIELCKALGDVPVMHTSTCFVAGNRDGFIAEESPLDRPFPRCDEVGVEHWDPQREIEEGLRLVERAKHEANEAFRESEFVETAKENLRRRGESCRGAVLQDELKKVRRKHVDNMLATEGRSRAQYWGWPNTYTYTKSMGEQLLLKSGIRSTIVRPAVVESSLEYPRVGWNEGIQTSAPLIYILLEGGAPAFPGSWDCNLDFIPNDMVCSGMILSLAALLKDEHKPVYQYGTSAVNPVSTARIQELIALYKRRDLRKNPKGNPFFNSLKQMYGSVPTSADTFRNWGEPFYADVASSLSKVSDTVAELPGFGFFKSVSKGLGKAERTFRNQAKIYELFMPFMHDRRYRFQADHTDELFARLSDEDKARLLWDPESIDWHDYIMKIHVPGVVKWTFPLIKEKLKKPKNRLREYPDLLSMLDEKVDDNPYGVCVQKLIDGGLYRLTYREFYQGVEKLAATLQQQGVQRGDRVILAGKNSPYWSMSYFAILRAGGVAVPTDRELDLLRFQNILKSSGAVFGLWDKEFHENSGTDENGEALLKHLLLEDIDASNRKQTEAPTPVLLQPDDLASLLYTSGTTGDPKGVMLSHRNFTSLLSSLVPLFDLTHEDSSLSVLPLHHTFEFTCGLLLPLSLGMRITYIEELNAENLTTALQEGKITVLVGVPALWQLLEKRIMSKVSKQGKAAKGVFNALLDTNRSIGRTLGLDIGKVLFAPVHSQLGGHLRYLISGAAALPKDTQKTFAGLGLHLTEGYGLTEAAPVLSVSASSPKAKHGQVGKSIPGVEIKIHEPNDQGIGEVWAKGPNVMQGYWNNEKATSAALTEDGWLRTGDLGKLDYKGRLSLMGRAKDVIVTANGENIYPDDIEDMLGLPKGIEELAVTGIPDPRGGEQAALLAVLKEPKKDDDRTEAERMADARSELQLCMQKLPSHSRPAIVHFQKDELPRTATRKVQRTAVHDLIVELERQRHEQQGEGDVQEKNLLFEVVADVSGKSIASLTLDSRLHADLGLDSLTMNELHVALERKTDSRIPPELLAGCETLDDIQHLLSNLAHDAIRTSHYEYSATAEEKEEKKDFDVQLPRFVQNVAKDALRSAQESFYDNMMKVKVTGRAYIPRNRNVIVVANHSSHLDLGLVKKALGSYGNNIVTLGAKDYFFEGNSFKKFYFDNFTNVEPVARVTGVEKGLETAHRALSEGKLLLLFPEGTRSKTGELQPFKSGVGHLVLDHEIDILPIYLRGTYDAWPKGQAVPMGRKLRAHIGPVLSHRVLRDKVDGLTKSEAAQSIALAAQRAIEHLRDDEIFSLDGYKAEVGEKPKSPEEQVAEIFDFLDERYKPNGLDEDLAYYFSLGNESFAKWYVCVSPEGMQKGLGKPPTGMADCVIKTTPEIWRKIIMESFIPSPEQFISGQIKTSDIPKLQQFVSLFDLS
jgi:long-chain acyl-CoA synthetase